MTELWRFRPEGWDKNAKVRVSRRAERQFGRVSAAQLAEVGVSSSTVARWTESGYLHPDLPAVYAVGHRGPRIEGDLAAALLYAGPGSVLSHATAAWWLGLIDQRPLAIEVSTRRRCVSLPQVGVHDRRDLERIWHNGLPVTTVSQTLRDFAATAPPDRVRHALAEAEYRDLLDLDALERVLGRGRPGSQALRRALARHQPAYARTRSELENAFLRLCERHRLPIPAVNVYLEGWLVDAVWFDHRLVVELDGLGGHRTRAQLERDHTRDLQLRAAGFTVVRYTWAQITEQARVVAADLRRMLGLGSTNGRRSRP
jgi:very-short-patch-repair endonuclease